MRNLRANIRSAIESLLSHRTRTLLSAVGIMVGAFAIVLLIGIAEGVQQEISQEVEDLGVNLVIVLPARIEEDSFFAPGLMGISNLKEAHIEEVKRLPGVGKAVPLTFVGSGLSLGKTASPSTLIVATRAEWFTMRKTELFEGKLFSDADSNKPVCVVGSVAYQKLFAGQSALGKSLHYNDIEYKVVGRLAEKETSNSMLSMGSFENAVFVPYEFVKQQHQGVQIDRIVVQTKPDVDPKGLVQSMETQLGKSLAHETYSVVTQEDLLKILFTIMNILTWLLVGLTSIALLVGGVGIMTIMLMSVNERTKEIGVRKTVGASRSDMFVQFLTEAVLIGLLGAIMGIGASWVCAILLSAYTPIKPLITYNTVGLALAVCLGVCAVFGILPALRAAKKQPVDSLRNE